MTYVRSPAMRSPLLLLLLWLFAPLPTLADTLIVSSILPSSRSVQVGEPASLFATIINAGAEDAQNCRIERDPTTIVDFEYGTTNPSTNSIEGPLNTPVTIEPGQAQTFFFTVSADSPRTAFEFKPRFLCDNAAPVTTIAGVNTIDLAVSDSPVPDVVALSVTVNADGVTTLPQRASSAAFAVATTNLGAASDVTVSAVLSDPSLPAVVGLCETNPITGACLAPSSPITGALTLPMAQGENKTFGFFITSTDDIPFDPAINRVFVKFTDITTETRGATSVALRSRERSADEPLQLVEVVSVRSLQAPLIAFDRMLGLHREVVVGALQIAIEGVLEWRTNCEDFGFATFSLDDLDSSRTLSVGDRIVGDLAGCSLGYGLIESGKVELHITNLEPARGVRWTLGGRVQIVEPLLAAPDQLPFEIRGGYNFSVSRGEGVTSEALVGSGATTFSSTSDEDDGLLAEFSITKTTQHDTGGVELALSGRLDSASLGGSVECGSVNLETPSYFEPPISGELVCSGLGGAQVKLAVASGVDQQSDILIDEQNTGQFSVVAADVNWFELSGNRLFERGTEDELPVPRAAPLEVVAQSNIAVNAMVYASVSDELVVANAAGLIILEPSTLNVVDTLSLPGNVTTMIMRKDGRTLFVGYDNRAEIQEIDVPLRTLQTAISLGTDESGEDLVASDIALDPTNSTRIAVAMHRRGLRSAHVGVALFESGVKLPELTAATANNSRILFTNEGRLFGLNTLNSESGLRELVVSAQGLSASEPLLEFFHGARQGLTEFDGLLMSFGRSPRFVDFDAKRVVGQITDDPNFSDKWLTIDASTQEAYYIGTAIDTYELENLTLRGRVQTELFGDIDTAALTPDFLVVAGEGLLSVFPRAPLAGGATQSCAVTQQGGVSYFDCPMNDSAFNPDTNQFLVSVGSDAGESGNSIAFVDAQTATIDRTVSIGSEPGDVDLSGDNSSLFVALAGSNSVVEIIFATDEVRLSEPLLDREFGTQAQFADVISASPDNAQSVIAALPQRFGPSTFRLLSAGEVVYSDQTTSLSGAVGLTYSATDSTKAFAIGAGFSLLDIGANGAIEQTFYSDQFGGFVATDGNEFISVRGQHLDGATLVVDSRFQPILAEAVGYDPISNRVLFLQNQEVVTVHDGDTGEVLSSFFLRGSDVGFDTPPSLTVTPNGAFLSGGEHGGWFIPPELYLPQN